MPNAIPHLATALAFLALTATPGRGAPALKDRTGSDRDPDLKGLHALIRKAVEQEKALPDRDEHRANDTIRTLVNRVAQAADMPERELPVKFDGLSRSDVSKEFRQTSVKSAFVVGGDVRGTQASASVILASNEVQFTSLENCIVVGKTVRFTGARNCVIIAEEFIRGTVVGRGRMIRMGP
jgi:hypothetical protein